MGPTASVIAWLNDEDRRSKLTPKAREQEWYKYIFEEANATGDEEMVDSDKKKKEVKKISFV